MSPVPIGTQSACLTNVFREDFYSRISSLLVNHIGTFIATSSSGDHVNTTKVCIVVISLTCSSVFLHSLVQFAFPFMPKANRAQIEGGCVFPLVVPPS